MNLGWRIFASQRDSQPTQVSGRRNRSLCRGRLACRRFRLARHRDGHHAWDRFKSRCRIRFSGEDLTMSNARFVALGLSLLSLLAASSVEAGQRHRQCGCAVTGCCATAAPACCSAGTPAATATTTTAATSMAAATAPTSSTYQSYSFEPGNSVAPAASVSNGYVVSPNTNRSFYDRIRGDRKMLGRY